MNKIFEEHVSDAQASMVRLALDYAGATADEVFIFVASEDGISMFDFFYRLNGSVVEKEQLNDVRKSGGGMYDSLNESLAWVLDAGLDEIDALEEKCNEFGAEMPTEIRIHYVVGSNEMRAKMSYEPKFSHSDNLTPGSLFDSWVGDVRGGSYPL